MATIKVKVTSRDMIKPSFPTPDGLFKTLQFSLLDQIAPSVYIPFIFFYQNDDHSHPIDPLERSRLLKKSLSETLVDFYPLAGSKEGDYSIKCDDQGVEYYVASVSTELSKFIEKPDYIVHLKELLPFEPYISCDKSTALAGVQLNHFSCGGVAIGACIWHKIADGTAMVTFLNAWAAKARGDSCQNEHPKPTFDLASHFPTRDLDCGIHFPGIDSYDEGKIVSRSFTFDKEMLDVLKRRATKVVKDPTRVEVVTAFIWKRMMEAKPGGGLVKISGACHSVNLRPRMESPILGNSFGNLCWFAMAASSTKEANDDDQYPELVGKLREAIKKIDNNFINNLRKGECLLELNNTCEDAKEAMEVCWFTSWCKFPLYEINFGWGKPIWVRTITTPYTNVAILFSTRCGEGIEAWVSMLEDYMNNMLELDHDLISLSNIPLV